MLQASSIYFFLFITIVNTEKAGIVVIPGLGRSDRLHTVVHNLKTLEHLLNQSEEFLRWDCIVQIYADRTKKTAGYLWASSNLKEINYITSVCNLIENPNNLVTHNLRNIEPYLIKSQYKYIFILLDDCKLTTSGNRFDMNKLASIMAFNNLTVASPVVLNANKGGGQNFRRIMQAEVVNGYEGYISSFVEMFAMVMTMPAYQAFWDLLFPAVNPYGWGYDLWYHEYAKTRVVGHKMGIITTIRVVHEQNLTVADRTDNTKVEVKWKSLKAQERFFYLHYNINLHKMRVKVNNSTWNGAALGYLLSPP